jgi:hypothetical protein
MAHKIDDVEKKNKKQHNRRTFLKGAGLVAVASSLNPAWALNTSQDDSAAPSAPATKTQVFSVGAIFNPYYRPDDWSLLTNRQPEKMPLLGAYGSDMQGSIDTQIIWAQKMGLHYFVAPYQQDRPETDQNLQGLFEIANKHDFKVGLFIDPQESAASIDWSRLSTQYFSHPAYLKVPGNEPFVGLVQNDSKSGRRPEKNGFDRAVCSVQASWRWMPHSNADTRFAEAAENRGTYLGLSLTSADRTPVKRLRVMPKYAGALNVLWVSPQRHIDYSTGEFKLALPVIPSPDQIPSFVILDSFNNWGISVPLEPSTKLGESYVSQVRQWTKTLS